ncbi:MAG: hypothetical protein V1921_04235 [Candidatus Altiarchaeota archaeon]
MTFVAVSSTELVLNVVNLVLAFACVIESALIFQIIVNKEFRQNMRKKSISIMELIIAWRRIIMGIVFFAIVQAYYLLSKYGERSISLAYELFVTAFLFLLVTGLFEYYNALKKVRDMMTAEGE